MLPSKPSLRQVATLYDTYSVPKNLTVEGAVLSGLIPQDGLDHALTVADEDIDAVMAAIDKSEGA